MPPGYVDEAETRLVEFIQEAGGVEMPITSAIGAVAVRAMARYGRGTGHPAKLNFGDCFSYACAKSAGVPLLFKGQDFIHTDIEAGIDLPARHLPPHLGEEGAPGLVGRDVHEVVR